MYNIIQLRDAPGTAESAPLDPASRGTRRSQLQALADDAAAADKRSPTSAKFVRRVIAARAARPSFFEGDLFADPAWDILLELYALRCEQHRISISSLCAAAAVPATTALRWIDKLHNEKMIQRIPDPLDARRCWVQISDGAFVSMKAYLVSLSQSAMPI